MEKRTYQMTVRFDIKAFDDIDAREQAKAIFQNAVLIEELSGNIKLQTVYEDKSPERVEI